MAIFSKSVESARNDVTKAEAVVIEWENKAAAVHAEARDLDANSGAFILADESQAERISVKIQTLERTARAYDGATDEAKRKTHAARRVALETETLSTRFIGSQNISPEMIPDSVRENLQAGLPAAPVGA